MFNVVFNVNMRSCLFFFSLPSVKDSESCLQSGVVTWMLRSHSDSRIFTSRSDRNSKHRWVPTFQRFGEDNPPAVTLEHHQSGQDTAKTSPMVLSSSQILFNSSTALLSGPCQPRWCLDHLKSLSCSSGLMDIPVFVQQDRRVSWDLSPPLGLQGSEEHLALALASLPQHGLPPSLRREGSCRRCMVVGNGGVLHGSHLGSHIDQYDVIIR